ncbi:hypothetical protein MG293_000096 [Ovis ammon polii]|uniref:Uncharacterized protein n=1 Tax=Ovis ammon polii TaxID=230172 RepID=A0AAD4YI57_OVIAM|nr:hypothetical protein MG293_000096 [Ovis ammon polii]
MTKNSAAPKVNGAEPERPSRPPSSGPVYAVQLSGDRYESMGFVPFPAMYPIPKQSRLERKSKETLDVDETEPVLAAVPDVDESMGLPGSLIPTFGVDFTSLVLGPHHIQLKFQAVLLLMDIWTVPVYDYSESNCICLLVDFRTYLVVFEKCVVCEKHLDVCLKGECEHVCQSEFEGGDAERKYKLGSQVSEVIASYPFMTNSSFISKSREKSRAVQCVGNKRLPRSPESVKISEATSGVEIPGSMSSSVTPGEDSDLASDPNSSYQTRQEYWNRLPFPPPGDLLDPGVKLVSLASPALQADSSPGIYPGKNEGYHRDITIHGAMMFLQAPLVLKASQTLLVFDDLDNLEEYWSDVVTNKTANTVLPLDDKQPRRGHGPLLEKGFQTFDKDPVVFSSFLASGYGKMSQTHLEHFPPQPGCNQYFQGTLVLLSEKGVWKLQYGY